jgi:hypothetical protein
VEKLSLKELKEQNASEVVEEEAVEEVIETAEAENDELAGETEADPVEKQEEAEEEPESWMQAEDAEISEGDQKGGFVPNHGVAAVRRKLKAKLNDVKDENTELKARIEALESGRVQPSESDQLPPRPKREDFDYDDDKYDAAVDEWNDKKLDAKLSRHTQTASQKAQAEKAHNDLKQSIDGHYDRASKLVESGKISEDSYLNADRVVRQTMDRIAQGQGDAITDSLISTLSNMGDGSEKVMYQLGVNPTKLARLESLMRSDSSGLSAAAYLGTLQSSITTTNKRRSSAPKPASKVDGEGGSGGPEGALRKEYEKAGDDVQARISIKRKAKRQGIDTNQW